MASTIGLLQQIRDLLTQGLSSRQVIDRGYAPGSVYAVQRKLRRRRGRAEATPAMASQEPTAATGNRERTGACTHPRMESLVSENARLQAEAGHLSSLQHELKVLRTRLANVEASLRASQSEVARTRERLQQALSDRDRYREQVLDLRRHPTTVFLPGSR
jgi:chromosome segregation ATPase